MNDKLLLIISSSPTIELSIKITKLRNHDEKLNLSKRKQRNNNRYLQQIQQNVALKLNQTETAGLRMEAKTQQTKKETITKT